MSNQAFVFKITMHLRIYYMSKTRLTAAMKQFVLFFFLTTLSNQNAIASSTWQKLSSGIQYIDLNDESPAWAHIHAFKINLSTNKVQLMLAKDFGQTSATANDFFKHNPKALIVINGGFFDHLFRPLGLRIRNSHQESFFKPISWWGIFFIKNTQPSITAAKYFHLNSNINLAIQSGPRLLVDGEILPLKPGFAERTALCITRSNALVLTVTENFKLSTSELAARLKEPPLNCLQALNLDGGGSSQIYAQIGEFKLDSPGFSKVSDALVVETL